MGKNTSLWTVCFIYNIFVCQVKMNIIIKNVTIKIYFLFCVQSEDPQLEFDFNCEYRVLWKTEHACPDVAVTSSTCRLHNPQRNLDIDLSPLTNSPGTTKWDSKNEDVEASHLISSHLISFHFYKDNTVLENITNKLYIKLTLFSSKL